jgi:hypothetical protein
MTFSNITTAGWTPTVDNLKNLEAAFRAKAHENDAFVFDLLGNSSIRFEQVDGTTAMPFKSNGRFHLGGNVVVAPPDIFKDVINKVLPILSAKGDKPCVIIPPLPRFLFARCCNDPDHCTNATDKDFSKTLLAGFTEIRNLLIRYLVSAGLTNFRVMDICCTTSCSITACADERLKSLRSVTAKDGVHYVDVGYKNLVGRYIDCLSKMLSRESFTPKKQVNLPLFSGEDSGARADPLTKKDPRVRCSVAHEDHPWVSPEVGPVPPEIGRGLLSGNCTTESRNSTRTVDGNITAPGNSHFPFH